MLAEISCLRELFDSIYANKNIYNYLIFVYLIRHKK